MITAVAFLDDVVEELCRIGSNSLQAQTQRVLDHAPYPVWIVTRTTHSGKIWVF